MKHKVVIGFLGNDRDTPRESSRSTKWRPTVSLCQHMDFPISRLALIYQPDFEPLVHTVAEDVRKVSAHTEVEVIKMPFNDPYDFDEVYEALYDFARGYNFDIDREDYFIHITNGTHVAQICLYLLAESHYFPAKLIRTWAAGKRGLGGYKVIDLAVLLNTRLASRFRQEMQEDISFLKMGIDTRNKEFNKVIGELAAVALRSKDPILLIGPTGSGKSQMAQLIFELKKRKHQLEDKFVEENCATIRGSVAMSRLFGHVKGAYTGATTKRAGLLKTADKGLLFLDEIGDLGIEEQAMLLRALEQKKFTPMGSDHTETSDFQLIAGTNHDLVSEVREGKFRKDLYSRIKLWTFQLPGLCDRLEDIEPNIDFEIAKYVRRTGIVVRFSKEAQDRFLSFATSEQAKWAGNFRDLNGAIIRMSTMAEDGRITLDIVEEEIIRLLADWNTEFIVEDDYLEHLIGKDRSNKLDLFDRLQLKQVLKVCRESRTISDAGRILYPHSRKRRKKLNDADRLSKYLNKHGIEWEQIQQAT